MTTPALPQNSVDQAIVDFQKGEIGPVELAERILAATGADKSLAVKIDHDRSRRCGFPEVIFAEGKTVENLLLAIDQQLSSLPKDSPTSKDSVFVTRVNVEQARHVGERYAHVHWDSRSRTMRVAHDEQSLLNLADGSGPQGYVNVICAGTADMAIALEAQETLHWMGVPNRLIVDVGVAGLHRLLSHLPTLRDAVANVVVAGMEGALPSVVGGLVATPVVAVPTSIGYGANFQGLSALLSMLNSCAANICVVNIDAGFKGAYIAGLIARTAIRK